MTPAELEAKYLTGDFKLKGEFAKHDSSREEIIERSEKYAGWTLPVIFPDVELANTEEVQNDYQSTGAQAVTHLANKIMLALFQPSRPFFRLDMTAEQIEKTGMEPSQIDEALSTIERQAMKELEKINARTVLTDSVLQLIITGNALVYMPPDNKLQNYSLRDYVIIRDLRGDLVKLIIRETKSVASLSDELAAEAKLQNYNEDSEINLYTAIQRTSIDKYIVWQEMEDVCYCHKSIGIETKDSLPWIPLTWNLARSKDYGTGLVENYAGDFHSLSSLAEAILDYATIITDVKMLVDPAGMTDVRELTEAPSGAYVHGREGDIYVHTANVANASDFLTGQYSQVERRIGAAFLMNTSVTRDAERVTAEEIRMQAQELEGSLGGVYSRLAVDLQQPLARRLLRRLDSALGDIEPTVVTGLESLSRNSELDRIRAFMQDLIILADVPEQVADRIEYKDLISQLGSGHGVDYKKFLKSDEKFEQDQQAKMEQEANLAGATAGAVAQAEQPQE